MIPGPRPPNAASFASGNFDLLLSIGCSSLPPSAVVLRAQTIDFKLEQEIKENTLFCFVYLHSPYCGQSFLTNFLASTACVLSAKTIVEKTRTVFSVSIFKLPT